MDLGAEQLGNRHRTEPPPPLRLELINTEVSSTGHRSAHVHKKSATVTEKMFVNFHRAVELAPDVLFIIGYFRKLIVM